MVKSLGCRFDTAEETACKGGCYCEITGRFGGQIQDRGGQGVVGGNMAANLALVAFKLFAGILGKSSAMVADAAHSASDLVATSVVLMSLRVSKKPADEDHPYGHGKAEPVAAKIVGLILVAAGVAIGGVDSVRKIASGSYTEPGKNSACRCNSVDCCKGGHVSYHSCYCKED